MKILNKADVKNIPTISPVWIVPIVALVIALSLVIQARLEKGEEIQINFTKASDIIAGQTLIKLKNVEVGMVKKVKLSGDLKTVQVFAEIDRDVANHLSENTRFWVAEPKISATGVSNLGTLISGVYIVMDPGEDGPYATEFEGLDSSPVFVSDDPGTQYVLESADLGSLDISSPIYFRQIRVGEVTGYQLAEANDRVNINVFIKAPYDQLVQTKTHFWNVSGVDVSVGAEGVTANMGSLVSLLSGGIAFETAAGFEDAEVAEEGHRFSLYPDRESVKDGSYNIRYYYLLKFSESVKGLSVGAPVEFRGLKIGEVVDIDLVSADNEPNSLHVYIAIEPQRLDSEASPTREEADAFIETLVKHGLRARMSSGNLLVGSKLIELVYTDKRNSVPLVRSSNYTELPTHSDPGEEMLSQVSAILEKIEAVPFDDIGEDLADSLASLKAILSALETNNTAGKIDNAVQNLSLALNKLSQAMESVDQAIAPDSELQHELNGTLKSVGSAADSVQRFLDELNRHPNALIYGVDKEN